MKKTLICNDFFSRLQWWWSIGVKFMHIMMICHSTLPRMDEIMTPREHTYKAHGKPFLHTPSLHESFLTHWTRARHGRPLLLQHIPTRKRERYNKRVKIFRRFPILKRFDWPVHGVANGSEGSGHKANRWSNLVRTKYHYYLHLTWPRGGGRRVCE
jgi:hypothetical protein